MSGNDMAWALPHWLIQWSQINPMDWVGYAAALLTSVSFVPQAWLIFRTRNVTGISLTMYSVFTLGVAMWLIYGLWLQSWPIIVANGVTFTLAATILGMKICLDAPWRRRYPPRMPITDFESPTVPPHTPASRPQPGEERRPSN